MYLLSGLTYYYSFKRVREITHRNSLQDSSAYILFYQLRSSSLSSSWWSCFKTKLESFFLFLKSNTQSKSQSIIFNQIFFLFLFILFVSFANNLLKVSHYIPFFFCFYFFKFIFIRKNKKNVSNFFTQVWLLHFIILFKLSFE